MEMNPYDEIPSIAKQKQQLDPLPHGILNGLLQLLLTG